MTFRVLIPCGLVGGYRLLEGDFASIYRVEVIEVWMRFECIRRLVTDRPQSKHSSAFVVPSVCISSIQMYFDVFYFYGYVHRNSILITSNKMQQYEGIYLLQNYSTCFGCPSHPSSGLHKNVTAASGTGHSI